VSKVFLLNTYDNIRTPRINQLPVSVENWFEQIKKSEFSSVIESARRFGKGHPIYDNIKTAIPAATYNFNFHSNKENINITGSTGLLYIDIDVIGFDINVLDTSKIFAYYKSFGELGYCLLVQVKSLNLDNFNATYSYILNQLGVSKFYDKNAGKATQFNVLSYDPDIFINYDSFVFESITADSVLSSKDTFCTPSDVIKKKEIYTTEGVQKSIRFNNLDVVKSLIDEDKECIYNWDGWEFINCWLPRFKIKNGKRNSSLISYCNNLVWLNPQLNKAGAITIMNNANKAGCIEPLKSSEIVGIVNSIFNYKANGTLKPIVNRKSRKIVFANYSKLTKEQKFKLCRELMAEHKREVSKEKIYSTIENWDTANGKITIRSVATISGVSKKTVSKYWCEFKAYVYELNSENSLSVPREILQSSAKESPLEDARIKASVTNFRDGYVGLSDICLDCLGGFYVANYRLYNKALLLIESIHQIMMQLRVQELISTNKKSEESIQAGDYTLRFMIYPELNTIEFLNIADGLEILLDAA
jgi:hypothetical protein